MVRIGRFSGPAETSGASDGRLIDSLPKLGRPHERFVVKSGAHKWRHWRGKGQRIQSQGRPAVLTGSLKPVEQFYRCSACIGLFSIVDAKLHKSVWLFRPGCQDPARPMIFKRSPDDANAVGNKSGREGVAYESRIGNAVKLAVLRLRPVNPSAGA